MKAKANRSSRPPSIDVLSSPFLSHQIAFENCPELAAALREILYGWGESVSAATAAGADITIARKRTRYHWLSDSIAPTGKWRTRPPHTVVSALCDLHYDWSDWFVRDHPGYLCLHSASVVMGGGAILFPSDQKAGKSVLTMQLAHAGYQIMGDDVVAISPRGGEAMALGLAPRLRRPLPDVLDRQFRNFVAARRGPSNHHYQYMDMRAAELAPFRYKAPVKAIVVLERRDAGPPAIHEIDLGSVVKRLIRKNFAEDIPVHRIFSRLCSIARRVPRYRLTYARGFEAVALLEEKFR